MAGLVASHFVHGVVDGVEIVLLRELRELKLAGGRAVLGVNAHFEILLRGRGHDLAEELGELRGVLGLFQTGLFPVHADLRIALAVRNARHGQIHADLAALALKVGAQTGDDLFLHLGGNIRAEHLADADDVLRRPGLLLRLQRELAAGDMAHRALRRGRIAFMNVTANRANPLFHNKILHQINFSLCCFYYRPLRSSGRCRKMSEPRSAPRRAFRR